MQFILKILLLSRSEKVILCLRTYFHVTILIMKKNLFQSGLP